MAVPRRDPEAGDILPTEHSNAERPLREDHGWLVHEDPGGEPAEPRPLKVPQARHPRVRQVRGPRHRRDTD